jgi:hypothetical protein
MRKRNLSATPRKGNGAPHDGRVTRVEDRPDRSFAPRHDPLPMTPDEVAASYDALEDSDEAGEQAHPDDGADAPVAGEA